MASNTHTEQHNEHPIGASYTYNEEHNTRSDVSIHGADCPADAELYIQAYI